MADEIWLIGDTRVAEADTPFPTNGQLLRKVYFIHNVLKQSLASACTSIADIMFLELERMGLRPLSRKSIRTKINRLLEEYVRLKKNSHCNQDWQTKKMESFRTKLGRTFEGGTEFSEHQIGADNTPTGNVIIRLDRLETLNCYSMIMNLHRNHIYS
jgi:hypothetical protein